MFPVLPIMGFTFHNIRFARVCSHVTDFKALNKKFNIQTSTAGLSISLTTKVILKILSPTI